MQVVVLAGGLGTRLKPLTENFPKVMIDIKGRPFLEYQVKYLLSQGAKEILFLTGFKSEIIEQFVSQQPWKNKVKILNEGSTLRGTGGALVWAEAHFQKQFVLMYGDSFLPIPMKPVMDAFLSSGKPALMTVLKNENDWDQSNVVFKNGQIALYDKKATPKPKEMVYIDYGMSVFSKDLILSWKQRGLPEKFDLSDRQKELSLAGQLAGFQVKDRFYEVGSFQGIKDFEQLVSQPQWLEFFDKN